MSKPEICKRHVGFGFVIFAVTFVAFVFVPLYFAVRGSFKVGYY